MADSVAFGNLAIQFFPSGENLRQRTFAQQISSNLAERFARIENVAIGVDAREHGREALEIAEPQERLDGARRPVDGLKILFAPVDDFANQLEVARILDQAKI